MSRSAFLPFAVAILSAVPAGFACSCIEAGPPCSQTGGSGAIFTGQVSDVRADIDDKGYRRVIVTFVIDESFQGIDPARKEVEVRTGVGGGDCGYRFEAGRRYFVYGYKSPEGTLGTGICSRTRAIEKAAYDLGYFHGLKEAAPGGQIFGILFDAEQSGPRPGRGGETPRGLSGVQLVLSGKDVHREVRTGGDGRFRFADLAPGAYHLQATLAGYAPFGIAQEYTIASKGCAEVLAGMRVDRQIRGRVLDESGKPVAKVTIQAIQAKPANSAIALCVEQRPNR